MPSRFQKVVLATRADAQAMAERLRKALAETEGNLARAAELLDWSLTTAKRVVRALRDDWAIDVRKDFPRGRGAPTQSGQYVGWRGDPKRRSAVMRRKYLEKRGPEPRPIGRPKKKIEAVEKDR